MRNPKRNARILGIDPGPEPGLIMLNIRNNLLFEAWVPPSLEDGLMAAEIVAYEKFLISNATIRRTRLGSTVTIGMVETIRNWVEDHNDILSSNFPAGTVKPWATDARLKSWGLYKLPTRHHRDAARHALYCAVQRHFLPARVPDSQRPVTVRF